MDRVHHPHGDTDPRPLCNPGSAEPTSDRFTCPDCLEVLEGIRWWLHDLAEAAKAVHVRRPVPAADRRATYQRGRNSRYGSGRRPVGPQPGDPRSQTVCGAPADTRDLAYGEAGTRGGFDHVTCPDCRTDVLVNSLHAVIFAYRLVDAASDTPDARKLVTAWEKLARAFAQLTDTDPTAVELASITGAEHGLAAALRELGISIGGPA